jgi:hypothetical protein
MNPLFGTAADHKPAAAMEPLKLEVKVAPAAAPVVPVAVHSQCTARVTQPGSGLAK